MAYTKFTNLVFVMIALVVLSVSAVSAFGSISNVQVNDVDASSGDLSLTAGEVVSVEVVFKATENADEVQIEAEVSGRDGSSAVSNIFDVIAGKTYVKTLELQMPFDIDDREEKRFLTISLDSKNKNGPESTFELLVQRNSFEVEVLDVAMEPSVKAGENFVMDVVLKNRGRQFSEDSFVVASIPALGISAKKYFGDLSPKDQDNPDKEDAAERRLTLRIPNSAPAGIYVVEFEAYNGDTSSKILRKVAVSSAVDQNKVVSSTTSKTFAVGEKQPFSVTIVNTGNNIGLYELVFETAGGLNLEVEEPVIAIPAGSSQTVKVFASADEAGKYTFAVNVNSDGQLVKSSEFTANVEGRSSANATVLITVILAIIFVVLLIVLIVLLTRKPEKKEEFGESYY